MSRHPGRGARVGRVRRKSAKPSRETGGPDVEALSSFLTTEITEITEVRGESSSRRSLKKSIVTLKTSMGGSADDCASLFVIGEIRQDNGGMDANDG
jgi:hypothetical protein